MPPPRHRRLRFQTQTQTQFQHRFQTLHGKLRLWSHCPNQLWETHRNNLEIVCVYVCGWVALPPRDVCCCQLMCSGRRNWNWNLLHIARCTLHKLQLQLQLTAKLHCRLWLAVALPVGCASFRRCRRRRRRRVAFLTLAAAAFLASFSSAIAAVPVSVPLPVPVGVKPSALPRSGCAEPCRACAFRFKCTWIRGTSTASR